MKLSAIITDYRNQAKISQREFARRCCLSNSYISFIENEYNPRTGKPIVPTLEQYHKIASGMGLTVHQLFELLDEDSPVDLVKSDDPVAIVVPDTKLFNLVVRNMSYDDYVMVIDAFRRTEKKMKEKGLL